MTDPKNYKYILFDLDGTVIDSSLGITNSWMHALRRMGIEVPAREELYKYIGPPIFQVLEKYYGMSPSDAERGVEYYREYYRDDGIFEIEVYPGMAELLSSLKNAGKKIILATCKPEEFAKRIIAHIGFDEYFTFIAGSTLDRTRQKKSDIIRYALDELSVSDMSDCLMVGDRDVDITGAAALGIDGCGVLHGFGSEDELWNAGAKFVVKDSFELRSLLV